MASGAAGASPLAWRYGGFWIRFGARFIDGLIFTIPMVIFFAMFIPNLIRAQRHAGGAAAPPNLFAISGFITFFLIMFVAGGFYEILMLKYRSAALGKMACGLRVIRAEGSSLSWGVCYELAPYARREIYRELATYLQCEISPFPDELIERLSDEQYLLNASGILFGDQRPSRVKR